MKTILLIGASSAVAKEVAKQLKTEGHTLISISRTEPDAPFDFFHQYDISSDDPMPIVDTLIDGLVYFPGTIDDVRIWNVVRTATEINDNKKGT